MRVGVLGPIEVEIDGVLLDLPRARERALLAALALHAPRVVSVELLCEAVWSGEGAVRAKALQTYVMRLRRTVGATTIATAGAGYRLAEGDLDAHAFDRVVQSITGADGSTGRDSTLRDALALWRGTPYEELGEWPPAVRERHRLNDLRLDAEEEAAALRLEAGAIAIAALDALVDAAPLRERRWALLMTALYGAGRQTEALRVYERARAQLREDLGVSPGPELVRVYQAVLDHDAALDRPREASALLETGAARDAAAAGARDQALVHYQRAVALIAREPGRPAARCDLLCELASARRANGDAAGALLSYLEAADIARLLGDAGRLARCALGAAGEGGGTGLDPQAPATELLEEALRTIPIGVSPIRVRLLSRLTVARALNEPLEDGQARAGTALRDARLLDDPIAIGNALEAWLAIEHDPADSSANGAVADELAELAVIHNERSWAHSAAVARAFLQAGAGRIDDAVATFAGVERDDPESHSAKFISSLADHLDSTRRGDWDRTRAALERTRVLAGRVLVDPNAAEMAHRSALDVIDFLAGVHVDSLFEPSSFARNTMEASVVAFAAAQCAREGELAAARKLLDAIPPLALATMARDVYWPTMLWLLGEAILPVGTHPLASSLYDLARPFADRCAINPGAFYLGSMQLHLARFALASDQPARAREHAAEAATAHDRSGAEYWLARSRELMTER